MVYTLVVIALLWLSIRRQQHGRIDGVRYDELAPMLLKEARQQAAKIASLEQQLAGIQAALVKMQPKDELVAQR